MRYANQGFTGLMTRPAICAETGMIRSPLITANPQAAMQAWQPLPINGQVRRANALSTATKTPGIRRQPNQTTSNRNQQFGSHPLGAGNAPLDLF